MAAYLSKRRLRPKEDEEVGDLNIVPYLDILMNLIIFMLLSMTGLAVFGIVNVNAPSYGAPSAGASDQPQEQPLLLTVSVGKDGFTVAAKGAVLGGAEGAGGPTVPKKPNGEYDFVGLNAKMAEIKTAFPNESKVIIAADPDVQYEAVVGTMDATREKMDDKTKLLFNDVTLATF